MLKWYVLRHDFNKRKIVRYNVLENWEDDIKSARKKKKFNNRETLKEWLKREFMYYFWSKSEHEIAVGGLSSKYPEEFEKIDIWYQLELNLDIITDYIIKEMNFRFKENKENDKL